jgi:hypothetical protein
VSCCAVPCYAVHCADVCMQGIFVEKHFEPDAQLNFSLVEDDPVTKQPVSTGTQDVYSSVPSWHVVPQRTTLCITSGHLVLFKVPPAR